MSVRDFEGVFPQLHPSVFVDRQALVAGQVVIGADSSVWPMSVVRGDVNSIRIGARSNIQDGSVLHVTHDGPFSPGGIPLVVGQDVTVGHRVTLHACTVGDRCLIGMNACVMDGAELGSDILLGAGSLVTPGQKLEPGSLYQGSPARHVRRLEPDELEMLRYSAAHYVRLKDRYLGMA